MGHQSSKKIKPVREVHGCWNYHNRLPICKFHEVANGVQYVSFTHFPNGGIIPKDWNGIKWAYEDKLPPLMRVYVAGKEYVIRNGSLYTLNRRKLTEEKDLTLRLTREKGDNGRMVTFGGHVVVARASDLKKFRVSYKKYYEDHKLYSDYLRQYLQTEEILVDIIGWRPFRTEEEARFWKRKVFSDKKRKAAVFHEKTIAALVLDYTGVFDEGTITFLVS